MIAFHESSNPPREKKRGLTNSRLRAVGAPGATLCRREPDAAEAVHDEDERATGRSIAFVHHLSARLDAVGQLGERREQERCRSNGRLRVRRLRVQVAVEELQQDQLRADEVESG